jgi:hypothetical protein
MKRAADTSVDELRYEMYNYDDYKVFRIQCIPSNSINTEHCVGSFSSHSEALRYMPLSQKSFDPKTECKWYYSIVESKLTPYLKSIINNPYSIPTKFPYC